MRTTKYDIRELKKDEGYILKDMLYEAVYQPDPRSPIPRDIIEIPEISHYIDDFGKEHDYCLVAEVDGKIAGGVWVRILSGEIKGYGYIDDSTPEFSISLFKEYRGMGIGTALMKEMISCLKEKGYEKASLSVSKDNYASKMYMDLGFRVIKEREDDYLMVLELNK